jgi:YtkA-like
MIIFAGQTAPVVAAGNLAADEPVWISRSGRFRLTFESEVNPIRINRIHSWILHLQTAGGSPVSGAEIKMQGGMPEHNHGLPTMPLITGSREDGVYRVEGVRFHMTGHWELEFVIKTGSDEDSVDISLEL